MAVQTTFPGVYVVEQPSGVRPIAGVSTATTLFIAASARGPIGQPRLVLGYDPFVEEFSDDASVSDLPRQVQLFFQNGGQTAYVMRIAHNATSATVTLQNAAGTGVLDITAANPGAAGEEIRIVVSQRGADPESTFTMDVFRWEIDGNGNRTPAQEETFAGLSMDPNSSRYAPAVLTQSSQLINAVEAGTAPAAGDGSSQSGFAVPHDASAASTFRDQWDSLLGATQGVGPQNLFDISVDGGEAVTVDLSGIDVAAMAPANTVRSTLLPDAIAQTIQNAHTAVGRPGVIVDVEFVTGPAITNANATLHGDANFDTTDYLTFTSTTGGDIKLRPGGGTLAAALRLGVEQGGLEVGAHAARRPAPNGLVHDIANLTAFGELAQSDVNLVTLDGQNITVDLVTRNGPDPMFVTGAGGFPAGTGGLMGIQEKLRIIRDAINDEAAGNATFNWASEVWGHRLAIYRTAGDDNALAPGDFATAATDIAGDFDDNVRLYTVGMSGNDVGQQDNPVAVASDGTPPQKSDYDDAYVVVDREVDIFNLLVLPNQNGGVDRKTLWGPASIFCQQRRAFLLMDPPPTWNDHQTPLNGTGASDSIGDLRIGLVKDYSAIYYPKLAIDADGRRVVVDPAGAIAGLMARIDATRGVWKAPAGTEADLRGIVGIDRAFSNKENGVLNPEAINTIRQFPTGIVAWGARTMDGSDSSGSEFKYVPVRRLLLYLEESIYRGLQWTVFEPNGETLWASIRMNVGNFLNTLFRQGAFAGTTPSQAYYVKCDAETTTPTDRNLGIVNVHVGVATLKPAEFVVLYFRQITLPAE